MGFKMNKVAVAVAATLGVTLAGIGTAQADEILFPYVVTSSTVTTLVSTINSVDFYATDINVAPKKLHYRYWYKNGTKAENNAAPCDEVDRPLPSSANDIVTFDVSAHFGKDNLGILFEKAADAVNVDPNMGYGKATFALLGGLTQPVRAFLVVDNNEFDTYPGAAQAYFNTSPTLAGEAIVLEFQAGAAWGYAAYNPSARFSDGVRSNFNDFSDYVETAGEVIAGGSFAVFGVNDLENRRGYVPVAIAPPLLPNGGLITKFFVTPIAPSSWNGTVWVPPAATATTGGQLRGDLAVTIRLAIQDQSLGTAVMYDRDEGPVSGQVPQGVTCVGAVDAQSLLTQGAQQQVPDGGWSNLVVGDKDSASATGAKTNTQEAIVIKLEYNTSTSTSFPGLGIINNAIWLRKGIKESIPPSSSFKRDAAGNLVLDDAGNLIPTYTKRVELGTFGYDENVTSSQAMQ